MNCRKLASSKLLDGFTEHNCRNLELNFTNGSNDYDGVARIRAGGGAAMHEEDLSQEVLWLRPAEGAATQGVLRHRGNKVFKP